MTINDNKSINPNLMCVSGILKLQEYISVSLIRRYGDSNAKNINRYLDRTIHVIAKDLLDLFLTKLPHTYFADDEDVKVLQLSRYETKWGKLQLDGKQVWMNTPLSHILFDIVWAGKVGVASAVKIRSKVMDALTEYAIEESTTTVWKIQHNFDFGTQDVMGTKIDVNSLRTAIANWEKDALYKFGKDRDKLVRNIAMGKIILASLVDGELLQEMDVKGSGRIYFKGLNLQNAPKAVRHAALGKCHLYDMRVGAFGVMAGLAKQYAKECGMDVTFPNIKGYIKTKDEYRMKICRAVYPLETNKFKGISDFKGFFGFYNVKNALTAIGFGAKRNISASWKDVNDNWQQTSLLKAFKNNKDEAERFIKCSLIHDLLDEYVECTKIVELRLDEDTEFASVFAITADMNRGQRLAMVYQTIETMIMASFMDYVGPDNVMLPVHDGVYLKHKIDYQSAWFKLVTPFISDKDFIQLDHTQYGLADITFEYDHTVQLRNEEFAARDYMSTALYSTSGVQQKKQVQTPWGMVDADMYEPHQLNSDYFNASYYK